MVAGAGFEPATSGL